MAALPRTWHRATRTGHGTGRRAPGPVRGDTRILSPAPCRSSVMLRPTTELAGPPKGAAVLVVIGNGRPPARACLNVRISGPAGGGNALAAELSALRWASESRRSGWGDPASA